MRRLRDGSGEALSEISENIQRTRGLHQPERDRDIPAVPFGKAGAGSFPALAFHILCVLRLRLLPQRFPVTAIVLHGVHPRHNSRPAPAPVLPPSVRTFTCWAAASSAETSPRTDSSAVSRASARSRRIHRSSQPKDIPKSLLMAASFSSSGTLPLGDGLSAGAQGLPSTSWERPLSFRSSWICCAASS
ncbi:MAG: hypothetical protein ACLSAF_03870 [Intestinimonas sp.]